eukprot:gnl/Carplike_NY0171/5234_a7144_296.p1 GENE.gnl/Carplike_NY0171/5234_a7144_296~~gnl/Carplike_NY0171/5234_a7144_296.p1  ORF type:complete len:211 (-),score=41.06 gnl/Carplike_NY0171/5234_a7144_296:157-789(-)
MTSFGGNDDLFPIKVKISQKKRKSKAIAHKLGHKVDKRPHVTKPLRDISIPDYLPNGYKEEERLAKLMELRKDFKKQLEREKSKDITVLFSFYDGHGSRGEVTVKKGETIGDFIMKALQTHAVPRSFSILPPSAFLFVKEDLILPHDMTFVDVEHGCRGVTGKMDSWGEDMVRTAMSTEVRESHVGKLVKKDYYMRHKHIYPLTNWKAID